MSAASGQPSTVPPRFQPLHERITAAMTRLGVPGVGLGILDGGAEHVAGFGVTNVDHPRQLRATRSSRSARSPRR